LGTSGQASLLLLLGLYEQYVTRRRTLNDLARETGMSAANMNRWAHTYNLPLRPRGELSHQRSLSAADDATDAPAILRPALQGTGGWQRLQRFAATAAYPTIGTAAGALGIKESTLTVQINRLERDLSGQLLVRAKRGQPMTLTVLGAEVMSAIACAQELTAAEFGEAMKSPRPRVAKADQRAVNHKSLRVSPRGSRLRHQTIDVAMPVLTDTGA
jgi:antitoxin (DNA-binding transcriptional repressor) of toxin-antitoxin stability system